MKMGQAKAYNPTDAESIARAVIKRTQRGAASCVQTPRAAPVVRENLGESRKAGGAVRGVLTGLQSRGASFIIESSDASAQFPVSRQRRLA
ncbi:MAG: hypothetical protein V7641_3592 [Blastocatellia bacterium]